MTLTSRVTVLVAAGVVSLGDAREQGCLPNGTGSPGRAGGDTWPPSSAVPTTPIHAWGPSSRLTTGPPTPRVAPTGPRATPRCPLAAAPPVLRLSPSTSLPSSLRSALGSAWSPPGPAAPLSERQPPSGVTAPRLGLSELPTALSSLAGTRGACRAGRSAAPGLSQPLDAPCGGWSTRCLFLLHVWQPCLPCPFWVNPGPAQGPLSLNPQPPRS